MHCNCLPFLDGFVQHDDNTFMVDRASGTAHPDGDNQMTYEGDICLSIYHMAYCLVGLDFECN
jgi:hypothetical protein